MTDENEDTTGTTDETALAEPPARPINKFASLYTPELADRILNEIEVHHRTLLSVCHDEGMPNYSTVRGWVVRDVEGFRARYHRALDIGRPRGAKASLYTIELSDRIVGEIEGGRPLQDICQDEGMPAYRTVMGWLARHPEFARRYRNARAIGNPPYGPCVYTREFADHILAQLALGRTLHDICLDDDMPAVSTIYLWIEQDRDGFAERYFAAREAGRPLMRRGTRYTPELATRILHEIADNRPLCAICRAPGMPSPATVYLWMDSDRDGFAARFHRARRYALFGMAEQLREIADDGRNDWMEQRARDGDEAAAHYTETAKRSRLRFDARRWILSKEMPEVYGNRPKPSDEVKDDPWADFVKLISNKSRGMPNAPEPLDPQEVEAFERKHMGTDGPADDEL